jgi:O-antigen/teichoic acid export membrane protein
MLKRALKLNAYSVASQGAVLFTGVLFSIILTRILPLETYGLLTSFISFVVFIAMLSDVGLRTTATRYAGAAFFSDDKSLNAYITKLTALRMAIAGAMGIGIFIFADALAGAIFHSPSSAFVFRLTGAGAIAYAVMHYFEGLVSAANKYEYTFAGSVVVNVGRLVLPVVFAFAFAPTAEWAIAGVALGYLAGAAAYVFFFRKTYAGFRPDWSVPLPGDMKQYMLYAGIIGIATAFFTQFDTVLLNSLLSPSNVGLYKAAQMVLIGVISLAPISYPVIFSFFVELEAKKQRGQQADAYAKAAKYGLTFFIPISVMMFALAPQIISVIYTPTYAPSAGALAAFAFLPAFYFLFNVNVNTMLARGAIRSAALLFILASISSIALNVLLIPMFGFVGSAMAYAGAYIVPTLASIPLLARRLSLSFDVSALARPAVISIVAAGLSLFAAGATTEPLVPLILFPAVCGILYLASMDDDDRRVLKAFGEFVKRK